MFDPSRVTVYRDQVVADLSELIRIPSVQGPAADGTPFGPECRRALDFVLERGRELGFSVTNVDGYAGHVQYGEEGPIIGVLSHLDVVPAGEGWEHQPFGGQVEDGCVYGRGASDNKGPSIASLYCLRAFADQVSEPDVRIRLIFGTNEESGFGCMKHYLEHQPVPDFGFSPDAAYPLFNREMGIISATLRAPRAGAADAGRIVQSAAGGEALNMVPGRASAIVRPEYADLARRVVERLAAEESVEPRVSIEEVDSGSELAGNGSDRPLPGSVRLSARGVSAHGGRPAGGVNAVAHLLRAVSLIAREAEGGPVGLEPALLALDRLIGFETRGESLGISCRDSESGDLSVNLGILTVDDSSVSAGINIRYPVTADYARIRSVLERVAASAGFTVSESSHLPPLFIPEDDPLIATLLSVYRNATGDQTGPKWMAGGTYARVLKNRGVSFGAGFSGDDTRAHQSDEFISIDSLMRHAVICTDALHALSRMASGKGR